MRELRVIGLTPDSAHIVCVDAETGQKYRLAADEKLRAAARGDLARFGQIEIETEATMRPRDIQARIRAGASVEQVTEESGMPASRVERFAYPVLLERARAAELAQKAHPVRKDGPAVETLIEVVSAAFAERGHNIDIAEWDAWKDEKNYWVAQLQWQAGRSVIAAHWRYQPDAHGGSVMPLDDPASDLIDPDFGRALRGLATILPEPAPEPGPVVDPAPAAPVQTSASVETAQAGLEEYYEQRAAVGGTAVPVSAKGAVANPSGAGAAPSTPAVPAAAAPPAPAAPTEPAPPAAPAPAPEPTPAPAPTPAEPETAPAAKSASGGAGGKAEPKPAAQKSARAKRGKAPMPSWEDVLLGVRSSGH
ncbi:septation protein SepH [Nocardia spumae]|uniref:septation protein SepH n=1 Tax=Nocardia spumae TaxID=2887190 RepID=UPI001D13C022|nr:septation protein SepH [Nocardia spumae]